MNNVQIVISLLHYFCNQCSTVYVYGSQFAFNSVKVLNVAKIDEIPVLNLQVYNITRHCYFHRLSQIFFLFHIFKRYLFQAL